MKFTPASTSRIRPIAFLRHLMGSRQVSGSGRRLEVEVEKMGFQRTRGPQNVDHAFQSMLLNSRSK